MNAAKIPQMFSGKLDADAAILVPELVGGITHDCFDQARREDGASLCEILRRVPVVGAGVGQNEKKSDDGCKPHALLDAKTTPAQELCQRSTQGRKVLMSRASTRSRAMASGDNNTWNMTQAAAL